MRLKTFLLALFPLTLVGAGLTACDSRSTSLPTSLQESAPGGFAFALDSATLTTAKNLADSLRVELRQGTRLRSVSTALDSAVRVNDLESGSWAITVGLYAKDGSLKYVGSDTVTVSAGKIAAANVVLRPAKGSVDIVIRIDSTPVEPVPSQGPLGSWILQTVGKDTVYATQYELFLDSTGHVSGTDGCNRVGGTWSLEARTLRVATTTKMACFDNPVPELSGALWATRSWKLDTSGNDRHLRLLDSLGKTLAVYGTYVLHPTGALVPAPDQVILVDSLDTAMIPNRVPVALGAAVPSDSGLLLTVTLPHPGVKVHLVGLAASEPMACNPVTVDTVLLPGQVVTLGCIMVLPAGRYALVGETDPGLISPQVLTPARVLVRDLKLDLCGPNARDLTIRDGYGKEISFSPSTVSCVAMPAD
jgi:heat shock protein HslJ